MVIMKLIKEKTIVTSIMMLTIAAAAAGLLALNPSIFAQAQSFQVLESEVTFPPDRNQVGPPSTHQFLRPNSADHSKILGIVEKPNNKIFVVILADVTDTNFVLDGLTIVDANFVFPQDFSVSKYFGTVKIGNALKHVFY
jgi:hypothetical protein